MSFLDLRNLLPGDPSVYLVLIDGDFLLRILRLFEAALPEQEQAGGAPGKNEEAHEHATEQ